MVSSQYDLVAERERKGHRAPTSFLSPPTSPPSPTSAAIVPRSGASPRSSLIAHLPVADVAPRNLLDHYLLCHQSLIRVVAVKIQRLRLGISPKRRAVAIGFGEPFYLACKVTSQIRLIRFLERSE